MATWPATSRTSAAASVQPDLSRAVASVRAESSSRLDRSPARSTGPAPRSTRPGPPTGSIARAGKVSAAVEASATASDVSPVSSAASASASRASAR